MTNKIVSRLNILIIEGQPKREKGRDTSAFLNFLDCNETNANDNDNDSVKRKKRH